MIIFKDSVSEYLDGLVYNLYNNEYFGFIDSSEVFVDKLIDFIYENIRKYPSYKTPIKIKYLGKIIFFTNPHNEQLGMCFLKKRILIMLSQIS